MRSEHLVIADVIMDTRFLVTEGVTASSSDRSRPVSFLLVLTFFLPFYFYCTVWLLLLPSFVVHMFHSDVKVGSHI